MSTPAEVALLTGEAAAALCQYIETHPVDLVVMTTHGRGGLSRLWLGSVADRMLRRLAVPILLLHPQEAPQPAELRHLLLALDGDIEEPVLEAVELLARDGVRRRYTLVRVVEPTIPVLSGLAARPAHLPRDWDVRQQTNARDYLERLTQRLGDRGWTVSWQVLVGRRVVDRVLEFTDAIHADGIVVGTHGARGMERVLLGSVADKIVRGAPVPVLVAPVGTREAGHDHADGEALRLGPQATRPAAVPA
jgi:nucleotide-binding universal stress UspA family protein